MLSIDVKVLIWTVVCFVTLMLLLDRFLFKPLLSLMDRRNAKINARKQALAAAEAEREEKLRLRKEAEAEAINEAIRSAGQAMDAAAAEKAKILSDAREKNEALLEEYRQELEKESLSLEAKLDGDIDGLALAYVRKLVS